MDFSIKVRGEREVTLRLGELPQRVHDKIGAVISRAADDLEAKILERIPKKTGRLADAVQKKFTDSGDLIKGSVSIRADDRQLMAAAGALEYGAHGTVQVDAHAARLDHFYGAAMNAITVQIPKHDRKIDLTARRFLRDPFEELQDEVLKKLQAAVVSALGD